MTARHPLQQKNCSGIENMSSRTSQPPASSASFRSADHPPCSLNPAAVDVDCKPGCLRPSSPQCKSSARGQGDRPQQEQACPSRSRRHQHGNDSGSRPIRLHHPAQAQRMPDMLACLLTQMCGDEGRSLADAFKWAALFPPITKQSLSELDIQNIIRNVRLRHDINFDKDLSFRPNFDGVKGEEKMKAASQYWDALVAEMELYARLFQGTPPVLHLDHATWPEVIKHAELRIPNMFETIQDVLKSLVPDRDHSRVEEHLDKAMLMQEIERGVCDLVRLAEWLAHLLKEHCAPMRDEMVDTMVEETRSGVTQPDSKQIVSGLRSLLGILEAMKLDVANHQIRNLKTLLINDTVNFERQYHLDRLVHGRSRVNIDIARAWYACAYSRFQQLCTFQLKNMGPFHFEIFSRAVVSSLFSNDSKLVLPETFYLDHDRLLALKSEISDIIHFQICFDVFEDILADCGYGKTIPPASGHALRAAISAIIGEGVGHDPSLWLLESDHIAAELVRQANSLLQSPSVCDFDVIQRWNHRLRVMFLNRFANHSLILESQLRPRVLLSVKSHAHASTVELFNELITAPGPPPLPHVPLQTSVSDPAQSCNTSIHNFEQLTDLSNRITHIIILHWRIWGDIAYVQEERTQCLSPVTITERSESQSAASPRASPPRKLPPPPPVAMMKTGDPPDSGQETVEYGSSVP